jgi:hypothetical protein
MWRPAGATYDEGRVEETDDAETADVVALRQLGHADNGVDDDWRCREPEHPAEVYERALDGDEISRLATE